MLAVEIAMNYLADRIPRGIPIATKVPPDRPDEMVRITPGGPKRETPVSDETLLIVQVYAPGTDRALSIIEKIREDLLRIEDELDEVLEWREVTGPVEQQDPDIPEVARWQISGYLIQALA